MQDVNWPLHWDSPEALHVLIQLWHVCFHRVRAPAVHPSFCVRYGSFISEHFTPGLLRFCISWSHRGLFSERLRLKWFLSFLYYSSISSFNLSQPDVCHYPLTDFSMIWYQLLEENNVQSKIVKLKLQSLTCLPTGNYVVKPLEAQGSCSFSSVLFKKMFCYCMIMCVVLQLHTGLNACLEFV